MSTVAPSLEFDSQPLDIARGGQEPSGALAWMRSHVWALSDQVLISGTNFLTGVFTANALADNKAEFGVFSSIYVVKLFSDIFQSTLITQAHNVIGATKIGRAYQRYTSSTAVAQLVIVLIEVILAAMAALIGYHRGWGATPMLVALIPSIIF